jgi:hypothetical protein
MNQGARTLLLLAAFFGAGSPAYACSIRQEVMDGLNPERIVGLPDDWTQVQIELDEFLVKVRPSAPLPNSTAVRAKGIRGTVLLGSSAVPAGTKVELVGEYWLVCFMPGDKYQRAADDQLIVWIVGALVDDRSARLPANTVQIMPMINATIAVTDSEPPKYQPLPLSEEGNWMWAKFRWPMPE